MAIYYYRSKLKKTSNNRIFFEGSNSRKNFDVDIILTDFKESEYEKVVDQESLNKNITKLRKTIAKYYFLHKSEPESSDIYVQGYALIDGYIYYVWGQKTFSNGYTLFGIDQDDYYVSINITDNSNRINTLLSEIDLEQKPCIDIDCAIGNMKTKSAKEFEDFFVNNQKYFKFVVAYETFELVENFFNNGEIVEERLSCIDHNLKNGFYYQYQIERKFDPYPYIKNIDKKLKKLRLNTFGAETFIGIKKQDINKLIDRYTKFNSDVISALVKEEIREISKTNKMNDDTKQLLEGAFYSILYDAAIGNKDVSIVYLESFFSTDDYDNLSCQGMKEFVCKKSSREMFVDVLFEILDKNEMFAKNIIDLYFDASRVCYFYLTGTLRDPEDRTLEDEYKIPYETEESKAYEVADKFVEYCLKEMNFSEEKIENLEYLYSVYNCMFKNEYEYDTEEDLSCREKVYKANFMLSKKLHSDLIDEYGKRITTYSETEKKKALNKNESFVDLIKYLKNGKKKELTKAKEIPKIDNVNTLES